MTKLKETIDLVEGLKSSLEFLYDLGEERLLENYEKFECFRRDLTSLLSTITKYRIQLNTTDEAKMTFGPNTRKILQSLLYNYDKIYEFYEEYLIHKFAPVEQLYDEMIAQKTKEDEDVQISIPEETKKDLELIYTRKKLDDETLKLAKFDDPNRSVEFDDLYFRIRARYRSEGPEELVDVLSMVYESHRPEFLRILENISRLVTEIARRPDELNLRILRINNPKLQEDLLQYIDAVLLLRYFKFELMHHDDIKDKLKEVSAEYRDEYYLYMHEPDMFALYDRWKKWLDWLKSSSMELEMFTKHYKLQYKLNSKITPMEVFKEL